MEKNDTELFEEKLRNLDIKYRNSLNVDDKMGFGIELEFVSNMKQNIVKLIKDINEEKNIKSPYYSISESKKFHNILSGDKALELKTPVLHNTVKDFNTLKEVCDSINNFDISESNEKGMHVHVNLSSLEEDTEYLYTLLKLYSVYEHVIFRYAFGESSRSNVNISQYSREISNLLYSFLNRKNLSSSFDENIKELQKLLKCRSYAINFHKKGDNVKEDTVEFRPFNSTTNPIIVQNNINLVLNMISRITYSEMDMELLNYRFNNYDKGFYVRENYSEMNMDDAMEFCDLVFESDTDKDYFLKQYVVKDDVKTKRLVS